MGVFFQKGRGIPALAPLTPYLRHLRHLSVLLFGDLPRTADGIYQPKVFLVLYYGHGA